jgi:pimeloyl-ACP methyl ester carboxylesterase
MAVAVWILGILVICVLLGAAYQAWGTKKDAKRFPPPGRLVAIGGHRLHILESGTGNATIVLEAGLMSTVLSWSGLQRELEKSFRVVSYDRAGLGWSDLGPMPRTAEQIVKELHDLLGKAGIAPPYVLVGHSFGGLTMPLFARLFPQEVSGVVLVDPVAPMEWNPPSPHDLKLTRIGAKVCRRASILMRVGVIRFIAMLLQSGAKKPAAFLVLMISRGTPGESGTVSSPWFAALPDNEKAMASVFWIQPKFALTIASQLENLPASAGQTGQLDSSFDKPVIILSASNAPEHRIKEHAAMAARLPLGKHILAAKSNHWIMQAEQDLVIEAIQGIAERQKKVLSQSAQKSSVAS